MLVALLVFLLVPAEVVRREVQASGSLDASVRDDSFLDVSQPVVRAATALPRGRPSADHRSALPLPLPREWAVTTALEVVVENNVVTQVIADGATTRALRLPATPILRACQVPRRSTSSNSQIKHSSARAKAYPRERSAPVYEKRE